MPEFSVFQNNRPLQAPSGLRVSDTLGRFELRRMLGQGAQATVWLAFDPRVQREVAIKVMRTAAGFDDASVSQWLAEVRSTVRVKHPNIVSVSEADIQDRQPYLVFEYVAGQTLGHLIAERGALQPAEAVALMMDVLAAVVFAHAAGVVHRDLKPSNVLVDIAGRARVMDFAIASRLKNRDDSGADSPGTVAYLSPQAANGGASATSVDVFAAGVLLDGLIMGADVDDALRAIIRRAMVTDPNQMFVSALAFLNALEEWANLSAAPTQGAAVNSADSSGTLQFLLRRMRHKSDFPALSDAVVRILHMATSETESVNSVTNEILKDVALTNKLLRLVNSAHYGREGNISTVSRAVTLVGFNGIRNMALSLVLLEHMQDKAHAGQLKDEFLRSLMAGSVAGEICPLLRESEEAFIGAMFQNLGRLLVQFYFPQEASEVRSLMQSVREPVSETTASTRVLGLNFEELGVGIAKAWGLPQGMQRCMRKPVGTPPASTPVDSGERIRWIALASNEIADVLLKSDAKEVDARITTIARKYAQALGVDQKAVQAATGKARQKLIDLAIAMDISATPGSAAANLLKLPDEPAVQAVTAGLDSSPDTDANLGQFELHATQTVALPVGQVHPSPKNPQVAETLTAGIQDITNAMVEDFKLSDVLRMILETMYRAMAFDRIIFCMRDAKTETITGRFGLGNGVENFVKAIRIPLKSATPDLFGVVCLKGSDTMISDAAEARIAQRLPGWYRQSLNAPTFLLLPLQIKGAPFGLIYADKTQRGSLELDEKELALLRTLRNQAVMAFKQSS